MTSSEVSSLKTASVSSGRSSDGVGQMDTSCEGQDDSGYDNHVGRCHQSAHWSSC